MTRPTLGTSAGRARGAFVALESASGSDDFAERLSLALGAANLSRAQLSAAIGVDKSVVSRWLSGQVQPTSYNLARISTAIAKVLPGFNMVLWTVPRAQFEAALGLSHPVHAVAEPAARPGDAHWSWWWPYATALAAAFTLLVAAWFFWKPRELPDKDAAPVVATASVAVMPFVNMSGDPAKDYLGDGIAEELLNDLANTPNLQVVSRTSSFSFKGRNADIGEIARKLHVRTVLEGSAHQEGRRVRIVAQLIDAKSGFHLWSASYDRDLGDILAVQDEIAHAIAATLAQKLLPGHPTTLLYRAPPRTKINADAYTAYLQGRYAMNRANAADFMRAAELFKRAATLEPDFAAAHASLALAYVTLFSNGERTDTLAPAQQEIAATLRLDPNNFTALLGDAQLKALAWSWEDADAAMQKLLRQRPNEPDAHLYYALLLQEFGLWDKSLTELRRAADLAPLVPAYRENVGSALHMLRRDTEAEREFKNVLALDPNFVWALGDLCPVYAMSGRLREAQQILRERLMPNYADDRTTLYCASAIAFRQGDRNALQKLAQRSEDLYARHALGAAWIPFPYAFLGDYAHAMHWLEQAYDDKDYNVFYTVAEPDLPHGLKQTPRWQALLQRLAFHDIARVRAQILARGE